MKEPKVSVIIPTFNRADFLSEAIQSALNQTYKNLEIIVVDDGSTDHTQEVLKPFKDCIYYPYKRNGGAGSARNLGIRLAKGEYVAFLDSDDFWIPEKLEKQLPLFEKDAAIGLVYSQFWNLDTKSGEKSLRPKKRLRSGMIFDKECWHNIITTPTVVVRKECFSTIGFFKDLPRSQDIDMWQRITKMFKVAFVAQPLAVVRIHDNRVERTPEQRLQDSLTRLKILEKNKQNVRNTWYLLRAYQRRLAKVGKAYQKVSQEDSAKEYFWRAFKVYPLNIRYLWKALM